MGYPDYLIHYNPNHDPKTGRFDFSTHSKALYDDIKSSNGWYKYDLKNHLDNKGVQKAAKDKELAKSYATYKKISNKAPEFKPPTKLDKEGKEYREKRFEQITGRKYDPKNIKTKKYNGEGGLFTGKEVDDNFVWGLLTDNAIHNSKSYSEAFLKHLQKLDKIGLTEATSNYHKNLERVAKEFCGDLSDLNVYNSDYLTYSSYMKDLLEVELARNYMPKIV